MASDADKKIQDNGKEIGRIVQELLKAVSGEEMFFSIIVFDKDNDGKVNVISNYGEEDFEMLLNEFVTNYRRLHWWIIKELMIFTDDDIFKI